MTFKEYRQAALAYLPSVFVDRTTMPELLTTAAATLFVNEDMNSEFAIETRKRLLELKETGLLKEMAG